MSDVTITVVDSAVTLTIVDNTVDLTVGYAQAGGGVPSGGNTGTVLTKVSATSFDVAWSEVTHLHQYVRNRTGATIDKGKVVYLSGATGQTAEISLARSDSYSTMDAIGITAESIANNGFGYVIIYGILDQVDTQGMTEGAALYVSATTAGSYTSAEPSLPNWNVQIGYCLYANQNNGKILVKPNIESVKADYIVDSSLIGRQILTAADAAAVRVLLGTGATVNVQTFDSSGTWTKPSGAAIAIIEMIGGGAGGAGGTTASAGIGGGAGVYQEFFVSASELGATESINIGAGGGGGNGTTVGSYGSDTQIGASVRFVAGGGSYGTAIARNALAITGTGTTAMYGGATGGQAGFVGGRGSGGGGSGSSGTAAGSDGGAARDMRFTASSANPLRGGGAAGGTGGGTGANGSNGTIHSSGFGNGAGGGAGNLTLAGGTGGTGVRGSGGGGGGRCTTGTSSGGSGGNGFVKITTICVA